MDENILGGGRKTAGKNSYKIKKTSRAEVLHGMLEMGGKN